MPSTWISLTAFLAAGSTAGLVCLLLVTRWKSLFYQRMAGFLGVVALTNFANAIGLLPRTDLLFWRHVALAAELIQPALMIAAGMGMSVACKTDWPQARWLVRGLTVAGAVLGAMSFGAQTFQWHTFHNGATTIVLETWGKVAYVFIVLAMTVAIAQLEVVLRASQEPLRHKLKFVIIGMGGLGAYQIYEASQHLLFPVWKPEHIMVSAFVTMIAASLLAYGLGRSRLRELFVDVYVSHQGLVGSMSVILIGGYLLAVGAMGTWLQEANRSIGKELSIVVIFAALVALIIAGFSTSIRGEIRQILVRNFYRSKYDYRAQWLQVTEAFQVAADRDAIMDTLFDLLIKTFPTASLSIWSFREADRRFIRIRSLPTEMPFAAVELSHPVVSQLLRQDEAVWLEPAMMMEFGGADPGKDALGSSGIVLCFPVHSHGKLIAFLALGKPRSKDGYGVDDCDLLRVIAHQVGMLLSHASLAEERRASVELEAVHRFSTFCIHDLKNLSARLSLVAQNAERHGADPTFQVSAMRTIRDTAVKMTTLMSKLSLKSTKLIAAGIPEPVALSTLIEEIMTSLQGDGVRWHLRCEGEQTILAVREEIHQVLLNILLNAKQAMNDHGDIWISLAESTDTVTLIVEDTGCGIPDGKLETLFHPAQSSRPGGLGIGLYQCKQIVELHQGTIQIRSDVGQGTQVQIELPRSLRGTDQRPSVVTNSALSV